MPDADVTMATIPLGIMLDAIEFCLTHTQRNTPIRESSAAWVHISRIRTLKQAIEAEEAAAAPATNAARAAESIKGE